MKEKKKRRMTYWKAWLMLIFCWIAFFLMGAFKDCFVGVVAQFAYKYILIMLGCLGIILLVWCEILDVRCRSDKFETVVAELGCTKISDQEMIPKVSIYTSSRGIRERGKDGKPMLIYAARYGRAAVVKYMLDKGVDVQTKDYEFFSALHAGVMSNDTETVKVLLEAGAEVNAKWNLGTSPIMLADYTTDLEIFRLLMAYGADPNQQNQFGISAMDMFANSPEILEILSQR